jgi:hypothetical protein
MSDPFHPSVMTKMRATLAGERDAVLLEALRTAGRGCYEELLAADQLRDQILAGAASLWAAPAGQGSQMLAAWNGFVLQTLGESLLDADYATRPGTVGYVPPATFDQVSSWLSAVEGWVSRARQARVNPDYDISAELTLPAGLPTWTRAEPCPPEHLAGLLAAIPPVREHVEVALFALERTGVPEAHLHSLNQLKQLAAEAGAAADYAAGLRTERHDARLHELIEKNLRSALELWFHIGQLAAMPALLADYRALRPAPRPHLSTLPGGSRFDPWILTDRATLQTWKDDRKARQAIDEMWRHDPDPAATMALKAEIDAAVTRGDVTTFHTRAGSSCYYECPWAPLYEVRRPVRIATWSLKVLQQFTMRAAADDPRRGGAFRRGLVVGPFEPTDDVGYGDPT